MLDDETRFKFRRLQEYAAHEGYVLEEVLEEYGLLVSHDKGIMIQKGTIALALVQLEDQQHTVLANIGGGQTVSGAVRGCIKFLEMFAKGLK